MYNEVCVEELRVKLMTRRTTNRWWRRVRTWRKFMPSRYDSRLESAFVVSGARLSSAVRRTAGGLVQPGRSLNVDPAKCIKSVMPCRGMGYGGLASVLSLSKVIGLALSTDDIAPMQVKYAPRGAVFQAEPGTLDHWLTERYCLYAQDRQGHVRYGDIHHRPWPLQRAEADLLTNTLVDSIGVRLSRRAPVLHYAHALEVVAWSMESIAAVPPSQS